MGGYEKTLSVGLSAVKGDIPSILGIRSSQLELLPYKAIIFISPSNLKCVKSASACAAPPTPNPRNGFTREVGAYFLLGICAMCDICDVCNARNAFSF